MTNDVHVGRGDFGGDSGDLGVMSGYVSDDAEDDTPLTHSMASLL